jgi:hypothetical protein
LGKEVRDMESRNQAITASWINIIAGVWLIFAPFVLGYANNIPRTNDIWLGIIVGVLAVIRAFTPSRTSWLSWANVVAGIWLIIAPFVLGYANAVPWWNDIILGIIVAGVALWNTSVGSATTTSQTRAGI